MKRILQVALFVAAGVACASAADLAILRNGNSIRHERREVVGNVTRLYLSDTASGYIEIPSDQIERFEKDTAPPPPKSANPQPRAAQPAPQVPLATQKLSRDGLNQVVSGAGERHQIDPDFINSVIRAESGFHQNAVSKKGAQGLMQLMPGTASELGVKNTFDPNANVEGGTKYLRELLEKYNYDVPKALAAYNAGSKRVDQYHGVPPYYETQAYIARIIRDFNRQKIAENPSLARKTQRTASGTPHASTTTSPRASKSTSTAPNPRITATTSLSQTPQTAAR